MMSRIAVIFLPILILLFVNTVKATVIEEQRPLTVSDIMKFNSINVSKISDNGQWSAYEAKPDFGDSIGYVQHTNKNITYQVDKGTSPRFSDNSRFVGFIQPPSLLIKEQSNKKELKKLTNNLLVVDLTDGKQHTFTRVQSYQFAHKNHFVAILVKESKSKQEEQKKTDKVLLHNKDSLGTNLLIVNLVSGKQQQIKNVHQYGFSSEKDLLAYAISTQMAQDNRLEVFDLSTNEITNIISHSGLSIAQLSWTEQGDKLGVISGNYQQKEEKRKHQLAVWQSDKRLLMAKTASNKWFISNKHELNWSFDQKRLFFSYSPFTAHEKEKSVEEKNLFDIERILNNKAMQTWHTEDAKVKTHAAIDFSKDSYSNFLASYDVKKKKVTVLADKSLQKIALSNNNNAFIGLDPKPYQKQQTWKGKFYDAYKIDLSSGKKQLIAKTLQNSKSIKVSQNGRFITYFKDKQLWVFDSKKSRHKNLSFALEESLVDEDNDRPEPAKAYGVYGWISNSDNVLVYDKYDIWQFDFSKGKAIKLTAGYGREKQRRLRIITTDKKQDFVQQNQHLLLSSFNTENKQHGFFELDLASKNLTKLVEGDKRYRFITKAKNSDNYLYTREDYREFPDLWLGQTSFTDTRQLSKLGRQTQPFFWGDSQLIEWKNNDGKRTQGRLITPANFDSNKRYPVLVYFYENYSDRLNNFSAMKVNHRPNFPFYSSNGYVIFQPDIHQIIGQPGDAVVKSIVPGVQKLIEMGIADANAIALHGHSWGGYGTAFSITKTDMFAAAIAGAPVSNMTSAYSGIRLKTGVARQFQYETGQSRLGVSLWQQRQLYIDNSPLFFADRIETPLLIQFGDADDAVPWQQGVELYMAMRRLDKNAIMLQYEGEPHHLKKYPNKLDYTIKVKQYLDHYLLGKPMPVWLREGEAYRP